MFAIKIKAKARVFFLWKQFPLQPRVCLCVLIFHFRASVPFFFSTTNRKIEERERKKKRQWEEHSAEIPGKNACVGYSKSHSLVLT